MVSRNRVVIAAGVPSGEHVVAVVREAIAEAETCERAAFDRVRELSELIGFERFHRKADTYVHAAMLAEPTPDGHTQSHWGP